MQKNELKARAISSIRLYLADEVMVHDIDKESPATI